MQSLRVLPPLTAICGVIALVLVNTDLTIPRYKGEQHPVDSAVTSVYTADDDTSAPALPVLRLQSDPTNHSASLTDTGQRVHVYIKNTYRDDDIRRAHSGTIKVLLVFLVLYGAVALLRISQNRRKASNQALQPTAGHSDV